ncbi:MAG: VWA domain-containing protein [Candidatus Thermoplasmatota archaeon]|nr:VWA domain-containing protein [Candidatus Thermoplasmatota archaeon]MCL5963412.1 VWA domain-containing protein [Candidatus Thermoplasmatota archaeon]
MSSPEQYLPDCDNIELPATAHILDEKGIEYIIKKIGKEGIGSLSDTIKELEKNDSYIRESIKSIRDRLKKEIESRVSILNRKYDENLEKIKREYGENIKIIKTEKESIDTLLESNFVLGNVKSFFDNEEALLGLLMAENKGINKNKSYLTRFIELLKAMISYFKKLFKGIFKKSPKKEAKRESIAILDTLGLSTSKVIQIAVSGSPIGNQILTDMAESKNISKVSLEDKRIKNPEEYKKEVEDYIHNRFENINKTEFNLKIKKILKKRSDRLSKKEKELGLETDKKKDEVKSMQEMEQKKAEDKMTKDIDKGVVSASAYELKTLGYLKGTNEKMEVTAAFIDRLGELIFEEEIKKIPESYRYSLYSHGIQTGIYDKRRLRDRDEIAKLDIVDSLIESKIHKYSTIDVDLAYIYNEIGEMNRHSILLFDKSGSMDENDKVYAAKRALTSLYVAIKKHDSQATVDVIAFDSNVKIMDFYQMWEVKAGEFTNTGEAILTAYKLFKKGNVKRDLYMITDGLPEAYTTSSGSVKAGDFKMSMEYAVQATKLLSRLKDLSVTIVLLKSDDKRYLQAAKNIASICNGKVIVTEPSTLATTLLLDFAKRNMHK